MRGKIWKLSRFSLLSTVVPPPPCSSISRFTAVPSPRHVVQMTYRFLSESPSHCLLCLFVSCAVCFLFVPCCLQSFDPLPVRVCPANKHRQVICMMGGIYEPLLVSVTPTIPCGTMVNIGSILFVALCSYSGSRNLSSVDIGGGGGTV